MRPHSLYHFVGFLLLSHSGFARDLPLNCEGSAATPLTPCEQLDAGGIRYELSGAPIWDWVVPIPLSARPLERGDRVTVHFQIDDHLRLGSHPHRARVFLETCAPADGKRMYLRNLLIRPRNWMTEDGFTTGGVIDAEVPVGLGWTDEGFEFAHVCRIGLNLEEGMRATVPLQGELQIERVSIESSVDSLPRAFHDFARRPISDETRRLLRADLNDRWRDLYSGTPQEEFALGVNLAWPLAPTPHGTTHLYGMFMDPTALWYGERYDLSHAGVVKLLREDFRQIRELFGDQALVRIFLFPDLRSGVEIDPITGHPLRFNQAAHENLARLLAIANDERVTLMPTLFGIGMADGVDRTGPDGAWRSGERADWIRDPIARAALVRATAEWLAPFKDDFTVLAWDLFNEPEHASALTNAHDIGGFWNFLYDLNEALQAEGLLTTIGYRNPLDAKRYSLDWIPTHLAQAHYYERMESRLSPFSLTDSARDLWGDHAVGGWGEAPILNPEELPALVDAVRAAGHRYMLLWDWQGDHEKGDGFLIRAHSEWIRRVRR